MPPERVLIWHLAGKPRLEPATRCPSNEIDGAPVMCPSQAEADGSVVLGHIAIGERLVRRRERRDERSTGDAPAGSSLRLAGECRQDQCGYWDDSCQLAAVVVHPIDTIERLPVCPIRQRCRWWLEHGPNACGTCSLVSYHEHPTTDEPMRKSA